jgi:hypothetical protein
MSGEIDVTNPDQPKKVLIVIANPARQALLRPRRRLITGQQQYSGAEVAPARGRGSGHVDGART